MNQVVTTGIVLARTNYGEADRILTFLTPDQGKVRLLAKGVRRSASKLAGGIELFSESHITFIRGRGDIGTLISTRLQLYYEQIVKSLDRTTLGYQVLKIIQKNTEDAVDGEYYDLLQKTLSGLNEAALSLALVELWFSLHFLKLSGHAPNLQTDAKGRPLDPDRTYLFDNESMAFAIHPAGIYQPNHIKLLRLAQLASTPLKLAQVQTASNFILSDVSLAQTMLKAYLRI